MKVAIHQPNYLPWIGYFYKLYLADVFVFHDSVPFSKRSYTKRAAVQKRKNDPELNWITVPIIRPHQHTLISQLEICNIDDWWLKHKRKLYAAYGHLPLYEVVINLFDETVASSDKHSLAILNADLIKNIANYLGIEKTYYLSSEIDAQGRKNELNINIVKQLGGTHYISGLGAKPYQIIEEYEQGGISLSWNDIRPTISKMDFEAYGHARPIVSASITDWLFKMKPEDIVLIFSKAH